MFPRTIFTVGVAFLLSAPIVAQEKVDPTRATAAGVGEFGFELFQKLNEAKIKEKKKDSVAISPFSVAEAMTMVTNGADKETRRELEELFVSEALKKTPGVGINMLTTGVANLRKALAEHSKASEGTFEFSSSNALWGNSNAAIDFKYRPEFLKLGKDSYGAELKSEDFAVKTKVKDKSGKEKEVQRAVYNINSWVDKNTKGRITELLSKLDDEAVAVLLNAIYAKGQFQNHFYEMEDGQYLSKAADAKPTPATFLTKRDHLNYYTDADVNVYSFNVGPEKPKSDKFKPEIALDIIVPSAKGKFKGEIASLASRLDAKYYEKIVTGFKGKNVELTIPAGRVVQDEAAKLRDVLMDKPFLLKRSFDAKGANFSKLGTGKVDNLYLGDVVTKTFYEVTPFGFEAAAATAVLVFGETAIKPVEWEKHRVDSDAIHVIRHIPTGMPLFIVSYDKPKLYTEAEKLDLIAEGYTKTRGLSAKVKEGRIGIGYSEKKKQVVIALTDKDGKVIKEFDKDLKGPKRD